MDNNKVTDEFLALVGKLCYVDRLPQLHIASMLNISQAKVSRLLSLARDRGIVRITVSEYHPRAKELEAELAKKFDLKEAYVIKLRGDLMVEQARKMLGYFASDALAGKIGHGAKIGLAGGRTIRCLIDGLTERGDIGYGLTAVQLMGNVGSSPSRTDASELVRLLVGSRHGNFLALNTPVYVSDALSRKKFLEQDQIRMVMDAFAGLDMAFVGIGIPDDSIFSAQNALSDEQIAELRNKGVVGEICGRFFDIEGRECDTSFRDRVIGIPLDTLSRLRRVFAVVSGRGRVDSIKAALRGGIVNSLIIDENNALNLLNS